MSKPKYGKIYSKSSLNYDLNVDPPQVGGFTPASRGDHKSSSTHSADDKSAEPAPAAPEHSILDLTFEEYKAASLNIDEQHGLIGRIREDTPAEDLKYIDAMMLAKLAKQLDMCIFPMCKMLHIDKKAVWEMMEQQFKRAYPPTEEEAAAQSAMESVAAREAAVVPVVAEADVNAVHAEAAATPEVQVTGIQAIINDAANTTRASTPQAAKAEPTTDKFSMFKGRACSNTVESNQSVHPLEPAKKKVKKEPLS
jgi:hypothetical protein